METRTMDSPTQRKTNVMIYWGIAFAVLLVVAFTWAMRSGSRAVPNATGTATSSSIDTYRTQDAAGTTATGDTGTSTDSTGTNNPTNNPVNNGTYNQNTNRNGINNPQGVEPTPTPAGP